ncbi:glycosyl hydrolase [Croceicoccus sp. F390]|uniref:Glycosyl hydrolase n=1 Tax=Croceicoccus esteveae TaxID=3075597 RepID=A0ABU2ZGX8_9SPHN|nr:glycosyl hydrolase [Croceicoccus sp. F390]MDT0575840.1 glycosyl hydrolase [Croceicoccus sp. F390]
MIEAAMIWNEPNNKSHWNPELDPDWSIYADTVIRAGGAIQAVNPAITRVLGGMSPIDPHWLERMRKAGALDAVDVVAVHGFPLDWNLWPIHSWPDRIAEIEAVVPDKPIWATEVGVGSFGAEEVQVFGVDRTAELLIGRVPNVYWYSLFDLPQSWGAETRHREAEGSSYYRHFYMGLIREDGTPKLALDHYARHADKMGLMQWFHYQDPRLDDAVAWMKRLGVKKLRTGLSWADSFRPDALGWFDRQMEALQDFEVLVTFCFTPEHLGVEGHHTSCAKDPQQFADFCAWMIERYAPAQAVSGRLPAQA